MTILPDMYPCKPDIFEATYSPAALAAGQATAAQQGVAYAAMPDADRDYMRKVVAVAVTMLFDSYKEDVMRVFSTGELSEFVTITAAMGGERVEDIYRRAWDLLSLPVHASHGQAPAGLAVPSMSADEVNAIPTAARAYIHQLATNTDPAGMVRENMQLRDTNAGLQSMYRKAADAAQEVVGCFHAAECEGLRAALAGTADEHLKDLVERRLMHALYAAQEVAGQAPAQPAPAAIDAARAAQDGGDVAMTTTQGAPTQAADSVLEDAARLDWLALAGPTSICVVFDRPHDSEVEVATDDVTGYGKTLRKAIDDARKQGANHE